MALVSPQINISVKFIILKNSALDGVGVTSIIWSEFHFNSKPVTLDGTSIATNWHLI